MTPDRFSALAAAFGSSIDCWPLEERDAAYVHLLAYPAARDALARETALDDALSLWTVSGPGAALAGRIALAAQGRLARTQRLRAWLSRLAGATALAGGVAVGAGLVALSEAPRPSVESGLYQASILGVPYGGGTSTLDEPEDTP